ncbi:MAG: hypothetical protein RQ847_09990 [Wenzhouxiangellaceae bacterium]|nr:hypothetical protein [Wenzhouxiangellaceae bacterium]
MPPSAPRILFVPASGPSGSGEVFRALALAHALRRIDPESELHLLISRQARIAHDPVAHHHLLDDTPARAGDQAKAVIERLDPALAIFDGSGRTRQLGAVRRRGGRVVWVSNRPGRRRRAFWPQRMRFIDVHVMVGQPFPHIGRLARALAYMHRVELITAGAITMPPGTLPPDLAEAVRLRPAVFVAGGGGQVHAGRPVTEILHDAAERFQAETGRPAWVVYGPQHRGTPRPDSAVRTIPALPSETLAALLERAELVVVGAGNMLSNQALLAGRPCVMTATGGHDQPARLKRLAAAGAVVEAALDAGTLADAAIRLAQDRNRRKRLMEGVQRLALSDDTARVARMLSALAASRAIRS